MPKLKIKYNPLPHQVRFHESTKPKVVLIGGWGSGKTYSLMMHMFKLMDINKGIPGGILSPTLKMMRRDIIPTLLEIASDNGIDFTFNKTNFEFYFPQTKSKVYAFHGEDEYNLRGPNLGFMLINEFTLLSKQVYLTSLSRIRHPKTIFPQTAMSGSPEEFNWVYEDFVENTPSDSDVIFASARENKYLHSSYITSLENSYSSDMQKQYIDGAFVNLRGNRAARDFDRFKHLDPNIKDRSGVEKWVSIDFNIQPLAATLWNRMPANEVHLLEAYEEVCLESSNTYELAKVLREKVPFDSVLYPDPAGKAGSTKSHFSDIDILKQGGFTRIKFKTHIPSVRDALNATNNLFEKGMIKIHPKCKNLIADLEQCTIKDQTFEIDKSNPRRTHWLDGLKNMVDYEFPAIRPNKLSVRGR